MSYLITAIQSPQPDTMVALASQYLDAPDSLVELRLDSLPPDAITSFSPDLPQGKWIATFRDTREGGRNQADDEFRIHTLQKMFEAGAGYIDIELATWERCNLAGRIGIPHEKIILSSHYFDEKPQSLSVIINELLTIPGIVPKIAWKPDSILDNFIAFRMAEEASRPVIAICMGDAGLPSRILAPKYNMFGSYCSPDTKDATAPGQVTHDEMREVYHWTNINTDTKVYGVIGNPVAHSMSPLLHNALFQKENLNAVYLPLLVENNQETLIAFLNACRETLSFNPGGFSVTVPHKPGALACLNTQTTDHAQRIGAVNTITNTDNGYFGTNTDYHGAIRALADGMACDPSLLEDISVDLLGAGGVARAIVTALCDTKCRVTIYNRTEQKAQELASQFDFNCTSEPWDARSDSNGRILINCTPIGMWPAVDETPFPADKLASYAAVFDTVYNPIDTRLLKDAATAGCKTISGLSMFIHQAAAQFETWTNLSPDTEWMTNIVMERLQTDA